MAALLLLELRLEELAHSAPRAEPQLEFLDEARIAGDEPRLEETRVDGDVLRGLLHAFGDSAHAVPRLEAAVPERTDEAFDRGVRLSAIGEQHEDGHVGMREEGAAAVAADRDQRDARVVDRPAPE